VIRLDRRLPTFEFGFKQGGIYYRPAVHINPIRREIARRYRFEEVSYSEDIDWAMQLVHFPVF
jgi:hypothetical protein